MQRMFRVSLEATQCSRRAFSRRTGQCRQWFGCGRGTIGIGVGALVGSAVTPQTVYVAPPPPVYYAPPPPVYVAPAPVYVGPAYYYGRSHYQGHRR